MLINTLNVPSRQVFNSFPWVVFKICQRNLKRWLKIDASKMRTDYWRDLAIRNLSFNIPCIHIIL
jgi:hypothetical protein